LYVVFAGIDQNTTKPVRFCAVSLRGRMMHLPRCWVFLEHAGILQHVGPLSTCARVAVLEMLSEVIRSEELFGRVALSELMHLLQMPNTFIPILFSSVSRRITTVQGTSTRATSRSCEFVAAVATGVSFARSVSRIVKSPVVSRKS
jgi:hypothetical protein